jgi:hypothetical protein
MITWPVFLVVAGVIALWLAAFNTPTKPWFCWGWLGLALIASAELFYRVGPLLK